VNGFAHTYFWDMPVDDNGFMLLKTHHKNKWLFLACQFAPNGKIRSPGELYGSRRPSCRSRDWAAVTVVERLTWYKDILPDMGPPETTIWEYPMADNSWENGKWPSSWMTSARDASPRQGCTTRFAALAVVAKIYGGIPHMIIARSPLRITLGGGGTDLASYYGEQEGFSVAAAIDKYVYVTVMRPFPPGQSI